MLSVCWAKFGFDVASAKFEYEGIIPLQELQLNLSNEFDLHC